MGGVGLSVPSKAGGKLILRTAIFMIVLMVLVINDLRVLASNHMSPMISPEAVVHIQLQALQNNDVPQPNAGIKKVWAFAHPDNKRLTGPLNRFIAMIKGPSYSMLLNHRHHEIQLLERSASIAVFAVRVTSDDGLVYLYQWQLAPVIGGENDGAWLTIGVSMPVPVGNEI